MYSLKTAGAAYADGPRLRLLVPVLLVTAGGALLLVSALNATLIYDDLYLIPHFGNLLDSYGFPKAIEHLFFAYDLGPSQYRLYGLSRVLHFLLWFLFGAKAWGYALFVAFSQIASGIGIYLLLRRRTTQASIAACLGVLWVMSPYMITSCFHHYSYLILPCQLAIACAFVLECRAASALFGVTIAWTGESHIILVPVFLGMVAFTSSSKRGWRQRAVDCGVPIVTMAIAIALHRTAWGYLVDAPVALRRYEFGVPSILQARDRTELFLQSLPRGFLRQVRAIVEFSPFVTIVFVSMAIPLAIGVARRDSVASTRKEILVALALVVLTCASIAVIFALGVFSGQISQDLPRRYGYVPYTLMIMAGFALLFSARRFFTAPAMGVFGATVGISLALQLFCLPVIRSEDRRVWRTIAVAAKAVPYLLYPIVGTADAGSLGLRGPGFPEIFESPLVAYWWEAQYSVVHAGASFVGYKATVEREDLVRLTGTGLTGPPILANTRSVAVVESLSQRDWRSPPVLKISILTDLIGPTGLRSYPP